MLGGTGCHLNLFGPPTGPGPVLTVTVPAEPVTAGQPSHWTFSWTKGAGAPYKLSVTVYEYTDPPSRGPAVANWEQKDISARRIEHDFVLPNSGITPRRYQLDAYLADCIEFATGFMGSGYYGGADSEYISFMVMPVP